MNLPDNPTKSFQARNPNLYPGSVPLKLDTTNAAPRIQKRIRQGEKKPNKWEREFFEILCRDYPNYDRPREQSKRYRLANGAWYKPDITASHWPQPTGLQMESAWEIKGGDGMKGVAKGKLTLKFAAAAWPEVAWYFCTKRNGIWQTQRVLP